jgi:hypothetical protein
VSEICTARLGHFVLKMQHMKRFDIDLDGLKIENVRTSNKVIKTRTLIGIEVTQQAFA